MAVRLPIILLIVCVGLGLLIAKQLWPAPTVVSGYIEADSIRVGSRVGGRVQEIFIAEGAHVEKDQLLVRLEPFDLNERLAQAEAEFAAATAEASRLSAGFRTEEIEEAKAARDQMQAAYQEALAGPRPQEITDARERVELSLADLELAQRTYDREEKLFGAKAQSQSQFDEALAALKVARARVQSEKARLAILEEGTREEQIAQAKARLDAAESLLQLRQKGFRAEEVAQAKAAAVAAGAQVDAIKDQIGELKIVAPVASIVQAFDLQPGDLVAPNSPALTLTDPSHLWVRTYVPEPWLGWIKEDQIVDVRVDSFPDRKFAGRIGFISTEAEFTPNNVQTPDERTQQVFRIKVELQGSESPLRPGMPADVVIPRPEAATTP